MLRSRVLPLGVEGSDLLGLALGLSVLPLQTSSFGSLMMADFALHFLDNLSVLVDGAELGFGLDGLGLGSGRAQLGHRLGLLGMELVSGHGAGVLAVLIDLLSVKKVV